MQDSHAVDDSELLRALAGGGRDAFVALVHQHGAAVHRLAVAMTGSRAAADDVSQEAFLAAWRFAPSFRGGSARAWLLRITRNAVHRSRRRRVGEPSHQEPLDELAITAGWGDRAQSPDFERALESRELLGRALSSLQTSDQEILTLIELEGMTLAEGASMLELEIPALKSRLHRARLRLLAAVRELTS